MEFTEQNQADLPAETMFEQSLRLALGSKGGSYAASLTRLLADLVEGQLSVEHFREQVLADPHLAALLKALVGQQAQAATTMVAFGQGSQVGDVTIRDIVGGHQFQLNIYHDRPLQEPAALSKTRHPQRKSPRVEKRASTRSKKTQGDALPIPQQTRRLRAFLCHANVDKAVVRMLYQRLHEAQIAPWLDEKELLPGQIWRREIPRAVETADVVLVCLSEASQTSSGYLQHEITFALDVADRQPPDSIFLIPLRLTECTVPERLARWQWVNLYEPEGFSRLLRALQVRAAELGVYPPEDRLPIAQGFPTPTQPPQHMEQAPVPDIAEGKQGRQTVALHNTLKRQSIITKKTVVPLLDVDQALLDLALLLNQYDSVINPAIVAARLAENMALRPAARRRAGVLAGRLGDPRYPLSSDEWRYEFERRSTDTTTNLWVANRPPPYWRYLPGGTYLIGGWEPGQAGVQIEVGPFWIARFVITVAQYEPFVAVGYNSEAQPWWEPASWRWKKSGAGVRKPRWWDEAIYRGANQPVIGVSWHEATAFCHWLNNQVADVLPKGYQLRLPTEAEWEVAAIWDGASNRRHYPWGTETPTPALSIYGQISQGRPAPVGCCPAGAAACGALDMAGNVWELTTSSYETYPTMSYTVVTAFRGKPVPWRGGSWFDDETALMAGKRFSARPDQSFNNAGFRIVLAPRQVATP